MRRFRIALCLLTLTSTSSASLCQTHDDSRVQTPTAVKAVHYPHSPPSFSNYSADPIELVGNPSVQKDLELLDEQVEQIVKMHAEWSQHIQGSMDDLRQGRISGEEYAQNLIAGKVAREKLLDSLLLPHQRDRLVQICTQAKIQRKGTAEAITEDDLAERLGLSKEQRLELVERSKKIEKRLADEIARLKREAKTELLSVLTDDQRDKLNRFTGDPLKTRNSDWREALEKHRKYVR